MQVTREQPIAVEDDVVIRLSAREAARLKAILNWIELPSTLWQALGDAGIEEDHDANDIMRTINPMYYVQIRDDD